MSNTVEKVERLREQIRAHSPLLIAYSGGVDSTYLLAEAVKILGSKALAVIADSPSLPRKALASAIEVAQSLNARLQILNTTELDRPEYAANPVNRCYFCKAELFQRMADLAQSQHFVALAYGENADDAFEFRPGAKAAAEFRVLAPLRTSGLTKAEIRLLSREHNLPTADQPAQPCLSSRVQHGIPIDRGVLSMVELAEETVRNHGFQVFRVRYLRHDNEAPAAKLQIASGEMDRLPMHWPKIRTALIAIGFGTAFWDPTGYQPPAKGLLGRGT
jgi:pyridinium-3,5-biscarboxylic acid mononucleotide sulfurtransferase